MNIGYVGVGNMGGALARRLQLQHPLVVYDPSEAAVQRMVETGSKGSGGLADVAARCDVIFLCLPTSEHVRAVIFGENGLATALKRGALIVDQTSGDPTITRALGGELAALGVDFVDAPVSGGPAGADAGTIAIMVGAEQALFERVLPLLKVISSNVFHAGGIGTGHVAKLANNLMSGGQRLLTLEAVALAVKNGMDPTRIVDIIASGTGRNFWMENFMRSHIIKGNLNANFTLGLLYKDVKLACKLGVDSGVTMFFGNLSKEFYQMAINEMGADEQVNAVALTMDRLAGTHVVPANYRTK